MLHLHLLNAVHSRMQTDPTQDREHLVIIDKQSVSYTDQTIVMTADFVYLYRNYVCMSKLMSFNDHLTEIVNDYRVATTG